jgi:hypothetical protein
LDISIFEIPLIVLDLGNFIFLYPLAGKIDLFSVASFINRSALFSVFKKFLI